jgi:hypothetical protein
MSTEAEAAGAVNMCCANCGIAGVDEIKLQKCHDCDLVKYCSDKCREDHREQHHEECKKRADELHDRKLFTQPDRTHKGECPICFLPMPLDLNESVFMGCCGKELCQGCIFANYISNIDDRVKARTCVFCRTPNLGEEEYEKRKKERLEANDPPTLCMKGSKCFVDSDFDKAVEYWTKAAELGNALAHYDLATMYRRGVGVEKDDEKEVYHLEKAAMGGHPKARHELACHEEDNGKIERAVKHYIIAANLGYEASMKWLLQMYKVGWITKEEYGAILRTHQATIEATKSSQREAALRTHQVILDAKKNPQKTRPCMVTTYQHFLKKP